uniref:Aldo_ket_red domain-containing protein n=1 Tax=Panagrellus redivivus TaxID=6233 RepID=A0A7E4VJY3_PANRE
MSPPAIPMTTLSNGVKQPQLGFGTSAAGTAEEQLYKAVHTALDAGYRYIDTAERYKNEALLGRAIKDYIATGKLTREDIFITSKLPFYGHADPAFYIEESLRKLDTPYLDMFMIHWSMPGVKVPGKDEGVRQENGEYAHDLTPFIDTWRVFEKYYKEGKIRSLGVCNLNEEQLQDLFDKAEIKPHNLQIECHIFLPQYEMHALCKKLNMTMTAYAPLGSRGRTVFQAADAVVEADPLTFPLVKQLSEKYGKTPAQILIRQVLQRGISTIPKSVTPSRIIENISVFDFELTEDEMAQFAAITTRHRLFLFDAAWTHPFYPWPADRDAFWAARDAAIAAGTASVTA